MDIRVHLNTQIYIETRVHIHYYFRFPLSTGFSQGTVYLSRQRPNNKAITETSTLEFGLKERDGFI